AAGAQHNAGNNKQQPARNAPLLAGGTIGGGGEGVSFRGTEHEGVFPVFYRFSAGVLAQKCNVHMTTLPPRGNPKRYYVLPCRASLCPRAKCGVEAVQAAGGAYVCPAAWVVAAEHRLTSHGIAQQWPQGG